MIIIAEKKEKTSDEKKSDIGGRIIAGDYILKDVKTDTKFINDCCFEVNKDYLILFQGVLLNSDKLYMKYRVNSVYDLLKSCYERQTGAFWNEFRGNYYGVFIDIKKKKLFAFTDHLSNKTLFYYCDNNVVALSDSVNDIANYCGESGEGKLKLCRGGAYAMLTYAYMYHDLTLFENVKRLLPGWYLMLENHKMEKKQYFKISNDRGKKKNARQAIADIDSLFLNAVSMQIHKNIEYNYYNFTPLSAGLDSRISTMALNRLHAENIINFTYSESGELDQRLPMKIAADLGNQWLYKNLDNGLDLFNIDEAVKLGDTLIYYAWPSQLQSFLKLIDTRKMGVVHTGVIGDIVVGSFFPRVSDTTKSYHLGDGAYSTRLINRLENNVDIVDYENYEIGMIYNRALNGACLGYSTTFHKYTEACSPFMDVDFFNYCLSLPREYRIQHKIYYRWVERCYAEALKYDHNGLKISTSNIGIHMDGKFIALNTIPSRMFIICERIFRKKNGMNPMDFWYRSNRELKRRMDQYFYSRTELRDLDEEIYQDAKWLYETGNAAEKIMAISLAGSVSRYFN